MVYVSVVLVEKGQNPPNPLYEGGAGVIYQKLGSDAKTLILRSPPGKVTREQVTTPFVKGQGGFKRLRHYTDHGIQVL